MWFNYSRTGMCCTVCVSMSLYELVPCNCSVTLPSFLLFSNPSCMGQHMERASIWAPSQAYLLDTQVGTSHSPPLNSPSAHFLSLFFDHPGTIFTCERFPCCIILLCVVCPFWVRVLDLFTEVCVPPTIPYVMLWLCKMGLSVDLLCVCVIFAGFCFSFLFFGWVCWAIQTKLQVSLPHFSLCISAGTSSEFGFEDLLGQSGFGAGYWTWGSQVTKGAQLLALLNRFFHF